jgi:hypothetical protein
MEKINVNATALAIFFIALAVVLVAGLGVLPAIQEAQARPPATVPPIGPHSCGSNPGTTFGQEPGHACGRP